MKSTLLIATVALCATFASCTKEAGRGGLAKVRGKVWARDLSSSGNLKTEGYVANERVFIGVDGRNAVLDDVRTAYDGSYEFRELRKGTYQVWVISRCDTCDLETEAKIQTITIDDKKAEETLPDFSIDM